MGGGYYDRDVGLTSSDGFSLSSYTDNAGKAMAQKTIHQDLNPLNRVIVCANKNPMAAETLKDI